MIRAFIIIGFISTILNLFGCSGQTKKDDGKLSNETKGLTEQIIDTTSDENLLQVIFDNLSEKLPTDFEKEYETVMSWNKSRQAIYMIWILEAEVNNGGYNQFYFNVSGQFHKHLPNALRLMGAKKFADMTTRANNTFEKENSKITQYQDGTLEGLSKSYEDNPLNKFDDEFGDLYETENLEHLQVNYIRKHIL